MYDQPDPGDEDRQRWDMGMLPIPAAHLYFFTPGQPEARQSVCIWFFFFLIKKKKRSLTYTLICVELILCRLIIKKKNQQHLGWANNKQITGKLKEKKKKGNGSIINVVDGATGRRAVYEARASNYSPIRA